MIKLHKREVYLNQLKAFQDKDLIKVMTGIRRCGKSTLMKLMVQHLKETGINDDQIIEMNFESMKFSQFTPERIYEYVKNNIVSGKRMYI